MQPKTIKSKNNNIFKMEDDINFFKGRRPHFFFKWMTTFKNIMQLKTIKSKNNDCGTAPGNLVSSFIKRYSHILVNIKTNAISMTGRQSKAILQIGLNYDK